MIFRPAGNHLPSSKTQLSAWNGFSGMETQIPGKIFWLNWTVFDAFRKINIELIKLDEFNLLSELVARHSETVFSAKYTCNAAFWAKRWHLKGEHNHSEGETWESLSVCTSLLGPVWRSGCVWSLPPQVWTPRRNPLPDRPSPAWNAGTSSDWWWPQLAG